MIERIVNSRYIFWVILIISTVVGVTALPYAINLFFRILLVLMQNPLETMLTCVFLLGLAGLYEWMKSK